MMSSGSSSSALLSPSRPLPNQKSFKLNLSPKSKNASSPERSSIISRRQFDFNSTPPSSRKSSKPIRQKPRLQRQRSKSLTTKRKIINKKNSQLAELEINPISENVKEPIRMSKSLSPQKRKISAKSPNPIAKISERFGTPEQENTEPIEDVETPQIRSKYKERNASSSASLTEVETKIDTQELKKRIAKVYSVVKTFHEPIPPVGDPEWGITGYVTASSFRRYMETLLGLRAFVDSQTSFTSKKSSLLELINSKPLEKEYQMTKDCVFIDVGSGMGRPPLCTACAGIRCSIGVELIHQQAAQSCLALKKFYKWVNKKVGFGKTYMQKGDILDTKSFEGITHVYSFSLGMPAFVLKHMIACSAWCDSVKTVGLYPPGGKAKQFIDWGLMDDLSSAKRTEGGCIRLSMPMSGGHSYSMFLVKMTKQRRAKLRTMYKNPFNNRKKVSSRNCESELVKRSLSLTITNDAFDTYRQGITVALLDEDTGTTTRRRSKRNSKSKK